MNVITMLAFTFAAVVFEGANLNFNKSTGVFGWTQNDNQFRMIILLGFGATFWGTAVGYTLIMRFWSPIAAMNLLLLEPILAQIYGIVFEVDQLPGGLTVLGVIAILAGIGLTNAGAARRGRDKKAASSETGY